MSFRSLAIVVGAAFVVSAPGLAQGSPQREVAARAVRATRAPVIDGRADDAAWTSAPASTGFRQFSPAEDAATGFRTEFRVTYDDRYLYVLVRAFDPFPDSIAPLLSRRDVKTSSDQIEILIDAYKDRRTGVALIVNVPALRASV